MKHGEPGGCCCGAGGFVAPYGGMCYVENQEGLVPLWYRGFTEPNGAGLIGIVSGATSLPSACLGVDYEKSAMIWAYGTDPATSGAPPNFPAVCEYYYNRNKWKTLITAAQLAVLADTPSTFYSAPLPRPSDPECVVTPLARDVRRRIVKYEPTTRTLFGYFYATYDNTAGFFTAYLGPWQVHVAEDGRIATNPTAPTEWGVGIAGYGAIDCWPYVTVDVGSARISQGSFIITHDYEWRRNRGPSGGLSGAGKLLEKAETIEPTRELKVLVSFYEDWLSHAHCERFSRPAQRETFADISAALITHADFVRYAHITGFLGNQLGGPFNNPNDAPLCYEFTEYIWGAAGAMTWARGFGKLPGLFVGMNSRTMGQTPSVYYMGERGSGAKRITIIEADGTLMPAANNGPAFAFDHDSQTMYIFSSRAVFNPGFPNPGWHTELFVTDVDEPPAADVNLVAANRIGGTSGWYGDGFSFGPSNWAYAIPDSLGTLYKTQPLSEEPPPPPPPEPIPCAERAIIDIRYIRDNSELCFAWDWVLVNGSDCDCTAERVSFEDNRACFDVTCPDNSTTQICKTIDEPCTYDSQLCIGLSDGLFLTVRGLPQCSYTDENGVLWDVNWAALNTTFFLDILTTDQFANRVWKIELGVPGDCDNRGLLILRRTFPGGIVWETYICAIYGGIASETPDSSSVSSAADAHVFRTDNGCQFLSGSFSNFNFTPLLFSSDNEGSSCLGSIVVQDHFENSPWSSGFGWCGPIDRVIGWKLHHASPE